MRRGSTKSLTFSIYNGQQVTKDRIAYMTNPQSYDQGSQRALFAAAAKFYSRMKVVLDHSWEGIKYGTPSQSEFMRLAIKSGIGSSLEKGASAYPFNYPISRGTLPTIAWDGIPKIAQTSLQARFASMLQIESLSEDVATFAANNGLADGDQISFVGAEVVNGILNPILVRVVIDTKAETFNELTPQRVYANGRVQNTTTSEVFSVVSGYLSIYANMFAGAVNNATWVLSRFDGANWLRSNTDFGLLDEENAGAGIASYTKQSKDGNAVEDASKFLNEGETKYGSIRRLVTKTVTINEEQKTVYANIDVACKFVKNADGSVTRYLMCDGNDMVMGEIGNSAYGYRVSGPLVEGASESSLLVAQDNVTLSAGDEWANAAQILTDFRNVTAFQFATT